MEEWKNEGFRDYADFLSQFTAKRRAMLRRERAAAHKQGLTVRTLREPEDPRRPRPLRRGWPTPSTARPWTS